MYIIILINKRIVILAPIESKDSCELNNQRTFRWKIILFCFIVGISFSWFPHIIIIHLTNNEIFHSPRSIMGIVHVLATVPPTHIAQ